MLLEVLADAERAAGAGEHHAAHRGVARPPRVTASSSASLVATSRLFIASGRLRVMVATPSATSYRTGSVMDGLQSVWVDDGGPGVLRRRVCRTTFGQVGREHGANVGDNGPATRQRHDRQAHRTGRGVRMAAMKPRTGDGPLEVTKEGRGIVMRVPLEGGGRLVVELNAEEAGALGDALKEVVG